MVVSKPHSYSSLQDLKLLRLTQRHKAHLAPEGSIKKAFRKVQSDFAKETSKQQVKVPSVDSLLYRSRKLLHGWQVGNKIFEVDSAHAAEFRQLLQEMTQSNKGGNRKAAMEAMDRQELNTNVLCEARDGNSFYGINDADEDSDGDFAGQKPARLNWPKNNLAVRRQSRVFSDLDVNRCNGMGTYFTAMERPLQWAPHNQSAHTTIHHECLTHVNAQHEQETEREIDARYLKMERELEYRERMLQVEHEDQVRRDRWELKKEELSRRLDEEIQSRETQREKDKMVVTLLMTVLDRLDH